jgi:DNA-binding transcriptional LysR family regulator
MDWADRIGRRIRLRDLHILLAVAECGSMSKASTRLSISHPVISKTVSDLERSLGVRLQFARGRTYRLRERSPQLRTHRVRRDATGTEAYRVPHEPE